VNVTSSPTVVVETSASTSRVSGRVPDTSSRQAAAATARIIAVAVLITLFLFISPHM
jgi:hypothetical protein